ARFVQRIGVNRNLDVVPVGLGETAIDRGRRRAPVFVELPADCAGAYLLLQPVGERRIALAEEAEVHGQRVGAPQHPLHVRCARRARRRVRAGCGTGSAADEGGDPAGQRVVRLLRTDEVNVRIDAARGEDEAFSGDRFGGNAHDHSVGHAGHHVGIPGLADPGNAAALDADVGLPYAGPVDDERVRDHAVERAVARDARGLTHSVPKHLPAAELALVPVHRRVVFDFCDKARVAEPDPIAGRGPVDVRVVTPADAVAHICGSLPRSLPFVTGPLAHALPPRMTRCPAMATSLTVFVSPGSNRTAVPAGMSRRMPYAIVRSNDSARLVSTK